MPSRELFTPSRGMEPLGSAETAAPPPALDSLTPQVCLSTAAVTSSFLTIVASGKWRPPRELFRPSRGTEPLASAATAVRPPAPNLIFVLVFLMALQVTAKATY